MGPIQIFSGPHDPSLNWGDLKWLKEVAGDVPIYLKGISSVDVSFLTFLPACSFGRACLLTR